MSESFPSLDTGPRPALAQPDFGQMRDDRMNRNRHVMEALDPSVMKEVLPETSHLSETDRAAVCIQKCYRGYKGRLLYRDLLFERFEEEERMRQEKMQQQVEEGQLLVDNHKLEVLLDDDTTTRRNRDRQYLSKVITIQRHWKEHLRDKHDRKKLDTSLPEEDVTSDSALDEDETSETESAICGQVMTLLTPEENQHLEDNDSEVVRSVDSYLDKKSPVRQLRDTECESVVSDVSEITGPLRDIESEVQIIEREELLRGNFDFLPPHNQKDIYRLPGETDQDYCKRARKINILSLAQEFAELKKVNADALPFDLHKGRELREASPRGDDFEESANASLTESAMTSPAEGKSQTMDADIIKGLNAKLSTSVKLRVKEAEKHRKGKSKRDSSPSVTNEMDKSGDFDVYNMESTLPQMDWATLEQQLQLAALEEKNRAQTRLNDREEIRRKLAMGTDEEYYYNERTFKKPNLQTRLQSGMNLQICFMNEALENQDSGEISTAMKRNSMPPMKTTQEPKRRGKSPHETNRNYRHSVPSIHVGVAEGEEDFLKKQARLQEEAKLALAQACTMAHMQLEVEKQLKKKSPIADMVGIPSLGDGRRRRIKSTVLHDMNLAQLQVLVNDLHTQIEGLNEELVQMLMERDDLHMEQDSMLVDIEDLSRRAEEVAQKVTNNNTSCSNNNQRGPRKK